MKNERLRKAYAHAGHSQTSFAAACEVSQPTMSGFAAYTTTPSEASLARMLAELELRADRPEVIGFLLIDGDVIALPAARKIALAVLEVNS